MRNSPLFSDEDYHAERLAADGDPDGEPIAGLRHEGCPPLDSGSAHPLPCLQAIRRQIALTAPKVGSIWRHYRGSLYRVIAVGIRESFPEAMVVYVAAGDDPDGVVWIRTLDSWQADVMSVVTRNHVKRFQLVTNAS